MIYYFNSKVIKKLTLINLHILLLFSCLSCRNSEDGIYDYHSLYPISLLSQNDTVIMKVGDVSIVDYTIPDYFNSESDTVDNNFLKMSLKSVGSPTTDKFSLLKVEKDSIISNLYHAYIKDLSKFSYYEEHCYLESLSGMKTKTITIQLPCDSLKRKLLDTGLTLMEIETTDSIWPTCEMVYPPEGMLGLSIKNASIVTGKITLMKDSCIVYFSDDYKKDASGMTIKLRGNSSVKLYDQKPYKIKLSKKADLLCRNDEKYHDKNWIIKQFDGTRTMVGFKVNELVGLQWTPQYKYVNLLFNGDYRGVYILQESVRRNTECRLNVSKTGYIFELDPYWWNEDLFFESSLDLQVNYTFKYPDSEDVTIDQLDYISRTCQNMERSFIDGTYPNYIDVESFAEWCLGHDILGNIDAAGSNLFLTKYDNTDDSKIMMAIMWDFDNIYASGDQWDYVHFHYFFDKLFNSPNKTFIRFYKDKWESLYPSLFLKMDDFLDDFSNSEECRSLDASMKYHNERWPNKEWFVMPGLEKAKKYLDHRRNWLNENISIIEIENE